MTSSTLTRLAPTEVALEFSITGEELAAAEDRAFRKLVRDARLPGFRKGKIPRKVFEQAYGAGTVTSQAVDEVVPEVYSKAIREHNLDPVDRPKLEVIEEVDGRPTRLKATVEVRPEIALSQYKGIAVSSPPVDVPETEVDSSLEALAKERATLIPVSREAREGDVATIDYAGSIDGVPFEGGTATGESVELREGRFIPGFIDGIIGMNPGESKRIDVKFPDEYASAEVAGKAAVFAITLHELKEFELPPIDDDLAKAVSSNQTVAQLRDDVRARLESIARGRARRIIGNTIVDQLLTSHDFPLPPSLVEGELERMAEEAQPATDEERASLRAQAESRVKATLLMEAIARAENITATPADLAAEIEVLARRYGQPPLRIRKALGNNLLSLMDGIVRNKTLDLLIDSAKVDGNEETSAPSS